MANLQDERQRMVRQQLLLRGISDQRILEVMGRVPRERFVPARVQELAYADAPLTIEEGQTISQPYVVALMAHKAEIKPGDRVLEIGTGSGYAAAVLAQLAAQVFTVERVPSLLDSAQRRFQELGYNNIITRLGDGSQGWAEEAPFDAIIVSAAAAQIPQPLCDQLTDWGRLVIPVGPLDAEQRLLKIVRRGTDFRQQNLGAVQFVPLVCGPRCP